MRRELAVLTACLLIGALPQSVAASDPPHPAAPSVTWRAEAAATREKGTVWITPTMDPARIGAQLSRREILKALGIEQ